MGQSEGLRWEAMQTLWMDFPHQWVPFLLLVTVWWRYMLECSHYIFQMSYSSTPVWKSIFYWERSVTEAKRKKRQFLPKWQELGDCKTRNSCVFLRLSLNRMETAAEDKTKERRQTESLQGSYCQKIEKLGHTSQVV